MVEMCQIGSVSLRAQDGSFLPSIPLYVEAAALTAASRVPQERLTDIFLGAFQRAQRSVKEATADGHVV